MITPGLNDSQMHGSSACPVRDGELLSIVAEERISHLKRDSRFPALGIQSSLCADQADGVWVSWQAPAANRCALPV